MPLRLSSKSVAEELNSREKAVDQVLSNTQEGKNPALVRAAEIEQEFHAGIRDGITETRTSLSSISVISPGTENNGNTVTMGVYVPSTDKIGLSIAALTQTVSGSISTLRLEVAQSVSRTIRHEERHQHSLTAAKRKGQSGIIMGHFGEETFVDVQETMARRGTTKGFDAYDAHESRMARLAGEIGMSLSTLIDHVEKGEESVIVEAAQEA